MGRRIPSGWRRPKGQPRTSWTSQLKKDTGVPTATSWRRAVDRQQGGRTQRPLPATLYEDDDDV